MRDGEKGELVGREGEREKNNPARGSFLAIAFVVYLAIVDYHGSEFFPLSS